MMQSIKKGILAIVFTWIQFTSATQVTINNGVGKDVQVYTNGGDEAKCNEIVKAGATVIFGFGIAYLVEMENDEQTRNNYFTMSGKQYAGPRICAVGPLKLAVMDPTYCFEMNWLEWGAPKQVFLYSLTVPKGAIWEVVIKKSSEALEKGKTPEGKAGKF